MHALLRFIPANTQANLFLWWFGLTKVPLIAHVRPRLLALNDETVQIRLPLTRRNQNHLKAMYFGAICIGADCAGGIIAVRLINQSKARVDFVFKAAQADFLKRVEGDAIFTCCDGLAISAAVQQALASDTRVNIPVNVVVTVPSKLGEEPVAKISLTLSMKRRK